jgi:hypothetical protein
MNGWRNAGVLLSTALFLLVAAGCSDFFDGSDNSHKEKAPPPPPPPGTGALALDITWAVKDDATLAQMNGFAARIRQASDALWAATEGQAYLRNVALVDNTALGQVILDNLDQQSAEGNFAYTYQLAGGAYEVHLGGALVLQDWVLPEEYDLQGAPCPPCAMDAYYLGTGEGNTRFCDASNCATTRVGCWENVILGTHSDWAHPHVFGSAPTTQVTIQNQ